MLANAVFFNMSAGGDFWHNCNMVSLLEKYSSGLNTSLLTIGIFYFPCREKETSPSERAGEPHLPKIL